MRNTSFCRWTNWFSGTHTEQPRSRSAIKPFRPRLEALEARCVPATLSVTSAADDNTVGTLRWAITWANAFDDPDAIIFDIPGGGVPTIQIDHNRGPLPTIIHPLSIDGESQVGWQSSGVYVNIDGSDLKANNVVGDGLTVTASGCAIVGLAVYGFMGDGILLANGAGTPGTAVYDCHIGTDHTGTAVGKGNDFTGILIAGPNNRIGHGQLASAPTVISGNGVTGSEWWVKPRFTTRSPAFWLG